MNEELETTRFGKIRVPPDRAFHFERGLIGFEALKRYALLDSARGATVQWLQSLERPEIAFLVSDPVNFIPGFELRIQEADIRQGLGPSASRERLRICTILHVDREQGLLHVHVQSPLLLDPETHQGVQVVTDAPTPTVPIPVGATQAGRARE